LATTFQCSVVTPEAPIIEAEVSQAVLPAFDGQVGVLAHRAPLLARLGSGPLRLDLADGSTRLFFVSGGFAQMKDNRLSILSDEAKPAEELDREAAEAALKAAQALRGDTPESAERKQRDLARARAMLAVAEG
jgi:F-type H+-transporting ATPase subunit epsilon